MRNAEKRTARILCRAGQLRRRRETGRLAGLGTLSAALTAGLAAAFFSAPGGGSPLVLGGLYGSMLTDVGAGGYVLTGVLAFTAGAALTALCMKHRENTKGTKINRTEKKEERSL